jgi:hypothetical protein
MKSNIHFLSYLAHFSLELKHFSGQSCRGNQNTHFVFHSIFSPENRTVYEIMWKKYLAPGRPKMTTTWRKRIECWISKPTNTQSQYDVALTAFPLRQWLQERVSVLRCMYITYLVIY